MFDAFFLEHPRSVGESYLGHMKAALRFAGLLVRAGLACGLHAFAPALCQRTGSKLVARLHDEMVVNRRAPRPEESPQAQVWADYAI